MIVTTRQQRHNLKADNKKRPERLMAVPRNDWPENRSSEEMIGLYVSRFFLVQVFQEPRGVLRFSVNRTEMGEDGRWKADISWDELQEVKRQAGYGDRFAVEIFPRDRDIVDVANMRHLWLLSEPLLFGWTLAKAEL